MDTSGLLSRRELVYGILKKLECKVDGRGNGRLTEKEDEMISKVLLEVVLEIYCSDLKRKNFLHLVLLYKQKNMKINIDIDTDIKFTAEKRKALN